MFTTIVVGTDGSAAADAAFARAVQLAEREAARLIVVHVQEFLNETGENYPVDINEDNVTNRIHTAVEDLNVRGVKTDLEIGRLSYGGPAHVIADVAQKVDADLIVVGTRGHNVFSQVVLGSVPIRLLHIAHRPVLVVPAP